MAKLSRSSFDFFTYLDQKTEGFDTTIEVRLDHPSGPVFVRIGPVNWWGTEAQARELHAKLAEILQPVTLAPTDVWLAEPAAPVSDRPEDVGVQHG